MSCTSPLKAFKVGINPDTGKDALRICAYSTDHLELDHGEIRKCFDSFVSPNAEKVYREFIEIPCGKCDSCKLTYARNWALRCMLELKNHDPDKCWFVTLTYDNDNLHPLELSEEYPVIGYKGLGSLDKKDVQKFFKRLRINLCRKYNNDLPQLKYFLCGEYGPATFRPHYHCIIYDLPLDDLKPYGKSHTGNMMWESEFLAQNWKKGLVRVQKVTFETCAYTARYVVKKQGNVAEYKENMIETLGVMPEFLLMSRNPGIAGSYYESRAPDIYKNDEIFFDGQKYKPPPYFDRRFEIDYPEDMEIVKKNRRDFAEHQKELILSQTDLSYEQILENKARVISKKMKMLRRSQVE